MDIKRIKQGLDITKVIGRYISLEVKGYRAVGLCPFHDDHHPSLTVDMRRQTFTCFACGAHGDVIAFVQRMEHYSFTEAVHILSDTRIPVQKQRDFSVKPKKEIRASGLSASVLDSYLCSLMPYVPEHVELTDTYLDFEVGLSTVIVPVEFKAMSGRIIFPIRNDEGRLVGFAGRVQDKGECKYVNSSAADGYRKGETLYGLDKARQAVLSSGDIYLTEGYKDVLAMHAAGFINTVALGGTALTDGQMHLLKKYRVEKVFLFLDGDKAGREAMDKISGQLQREGMDTLLIVTEGDHDPDSLFREIGKEAFTGYVHAASYPQVLLRSADSLYNEMALQETIQELIRRYRRTDDVYLRSDLLHLLYHRLDQYRLLSLELKRNGAV